MDLVPTLFSTGWASGVNAYLTVALLSLLGRSGVDAVPEALQGNTVLTVALGMFAIEFVTDKVPFLDSIWDTVHTAVRPAVGSALGVAFAGDANVTGLEEAYAGGGSGATALVSHGVKAALRLAINASPEPLSNILMSLFEDGLAAAVVAFSVEFPYIAAAIALLCLVLGVSLAYFLATRIRRALGALRERSRPPPRGI